MSIKTGRCRFTAMKNERIFGRDCRSVGIVKTLGNRIAKRTFATTVTLLDGVPIESVSKMMWHTNIRTTQLYAKMLDEKVSSDMAPLRQIFASI